MIYDCLSIEQLYLFLEITQMTVIASTSDSITVMGLELFTWTWVPRIDMFCLQTPPNA